MDFGAIDANYQALGERLEVLKNAGSNAAARESNLETAREAKLDADRQLAEADEACERALGQLVDSLAEAGVIPPTRPPVVEVREDLTAPAPLPQPPGDDEQSA